MRRIGYGVRLLNVLILLPMLVITCAPSNPSERPRREQGKVVSVFDGDTVLLDTGRRVRYLNVDAPELGKDGCPGDCFAEEAREANARLVLNRRVVLEYGERRVDRYGRCLARVFDLEGRSVGAELVRSGHACVFRSSDDDSDMSDLVALQRDAVRRRLGMWGKCPVRAAGGYVANRKTSVFHRLECRMGRFVSRENRVSFKSRWDGLEEGFRPCRRCKP
ncbi:MAG: thermonuclease family protein [Syntrophobacteraceae bacterium]|nr:thermonuclease family protein [Syntrophobacteraceae bacterium]